MKITLDSNDIDVLARKAKTMIENNPPSDYRVTMTLKRYGIPFVVTAEETNEEGRYEIVDIDAYGLNARNITIDYDWRYLQHYGRFYVG